MQEAAWGVGVGQEWVTGGDRASKVGHGRDQGLVRGTKGRGRE